MNTITNFEQFTNEQELDIKTITVSELQSVLLLERRDTKFVFHREQLARVMENLSKEYSILEDAQTRLFPYHTVYFDTVDFLLYKSHHNGKRNRYKIRSREYLATGTFFDEIKFKSNKGCTRKSRQKRSSLSTVIDTDFAHLISRNSPIEPTALQAVLQSNFKRMTLVNREFTERLTIDLGLYFVAHGEKCSYEDIVIVELKQDIKKKDSCASRIFKDNQIYSVTNSKYCLGIQSMYPSVKSNKFKPRLRYIQKISSRLR